ncbi:helix-turn-helix domain-containing protein [Streptomyces macrosporus]|uniref:Sigma-54 factor interaction domain-containing protein n=1 Tax=Streptomyces macrosporus TaxID=44032 RepID=A0ABN3JCT3_9ACTN
MEEAIRALRHDRSVIVRHLESLPQEEVNRVKALAALAHGAGTSARDDGADPVAPRARLVLTLNPQVCSPAVTELVSQIAERVEVPALATTRERIPELIRSILDSLEPARRCTLSSAALQAFLRWNWPGNVAELRRTLEKLAHDRPGRMIWHEHLPPHLRAAVRRRPLTRIESVERDAIVAAPAQAAGNRSRAADLLGIGRTTLYRKMRALGIEAPEQRAL